MTRRLASFASTGGKKAACGACGCVHHAWYDRKIRRVRDLPCGDTRVYLEVEIRRVECKTCGKVKQETLDWLADNPFHTNRFAFFVGRRCRTMTIKDVAEETRLNWKTIKALDAQYMQEQLRRAGTPTPKVVGIDESSIRKGHTYRIVVSDLARRQPIWFGGKDRSEESMDAFYQWLGVSKSKKIRLAVMDMWKAFRNSTRKPEHAPYAAILFDKFHVLRHLGAALDTVRKAEYYRLTGKDRRFIKGQQYTLLSHRENLTTDGRRSLKLLLKANRRLNTAYLLKEEFGQLWDYEREGWARRFFENWRASLKWQRLKPYEKFAEMIDRHWDGIAAYCKPENKVALGFVEGMNNKIRVMQRRSYGLRDEEYLRLKVLTCMLDPI
ncbi:MAG: ISL3 family transposase [Nitrospira sp.]